MPTQQIVLPPSRAAMFLTLVVEPGHESDVVDVLGDVSSMSRSVGYRAPDENLDVVIGLGADFWDRAWGESTRPRHLRPFAEIKGERHTAPATGGDLLVHLRAGRLDLCFEVATLLRERLLGHARIVDEVHGFKFFDDRDLLGFVDGSENPEVARAERAAIVDDDAEPYNGGSYVITQKYLHALDAWRALSVDEQQKVIGRTKADNVEFSDNDKPADSHIKLNVIYDDAGNQLQIVRDNMPFGSVAAGEFGTFFIGYAKDPAVVERMLRNMFVGDPVGTTDRILEFSTAHTGALWYVPTQEFLDDPRPVGRTAA